mmetsp:Transcript_2630/g.2227  ORF Transcript_2630/g.2227 Transcript_2630/m.2227 type:complete len:211 (-) Transcript_2630:28-660(-)
MEKNQDKEIIRTLGDKEQHLPYIKRVRIDNIDKVVCESINIFLTSCIPVTLPLLCLNRVTRRLLNGSNLINGICKASPSVTREIFLHFMEFSAEEIQRIVRSATKTHRLVFSSCKLNTNDHMDFNTNSVLTYLSFDCCGYDDSVSMKWDEYPERFENIVKAISKSNLKDSLTIINICNCDISVSKVEEQLSKYNISHINVVEQTDEPLEN